jgi:N6-adenosine-specific RNA methylase IME4
LSLYTTIVADPPWPYRAPGKFGNTLEHRPNRDKTINAGNAGSRCRYGAMEISDLCAMPVPSADDAHLYLWFTNAFAVEAHAIAKAWGFRPATLLTWVKTRHADGQPSMKMGYYFRGATEHVLFGVRGSLRLRAQRALPTAYFWPRLPHSVKPEPFYALVEEASPGPYLELFARKVRPGWDAWGNEVSGIELPLIAV